MKEDKPFVMFNALWFKKDGGKESYLKYMAAAGPLLKKYGARPLTGGIPNQALIGEFDADLIFFVGYPNWQAFQNFVNDPDYRKIRRFREEAITRSLLIRCEQM